jgi:L-alanine-DL-glutamate epimerase-like enolase superfamily enzyme
VYGLGEVRDGAGYQYAMVLKSRLVGENPLKIDYLFQKIQKFGGISRQAGGVCAVEIALWDIAGKVYNCPVYQMLGGQWRTRFASTRTLPSQTTRKSMDGEPKNVRRWGSHG